MSKLYVTTSANLAAARAAAGDADMFACLASATGTEPATHHLAYGIVPDEVEAAIAPYCAIYDGTVEDGLQASGLKRILPTTPPL